MKKLRFTFETTMEYSVPVWQHQLALRCLPRDGGGQRLLEGTVELAPGRLPLPQTDGFGNRVYWCSVNEPHSTLRYGSRGVALVEGRPGRPAPPPNPALSFPGARTRPGPGLLRLAASLPGEGTPEAARALCRQVHGLLRYQAGATAMGTSAEEALKGGAGVCQDYAHIFLALARLAGWPARYCMGLTVGEGATHAWAEVYLEGGWHGFDPTRNCPADDRYLCFATGRDAADCPVEQGTFWGLADQTQTVFMRVEEA